MGTTEDLKNKELELKIENEDKKEDSKRIMTWVVVTFLMLFILLVLFAPSLGLQMAESSVINTLTITGIPALVGIVMVFFGADAYAKKR